MRTTTRTFVALAAASTLLLGAVAPASAKSSSTFKESGSFASIDLTGPETSDTIPGNYLLGGIDVFGGFARGGALALECPEGADPLTGDECDVVADVGFDGPVTMTTGKGKASGTTVTGDIFAYTFVFDEETGEGFVEDLGVLPLDASLSPYGKKMTLRGSETFTDPNTGVSFTSRWSQTAQPATVDGTFGDLGLSGEGFVGTYKNMSSDRQR